MAVTNDESSSLKATLVSTHDRGVRVPIEQTCVRCHMGGEPWICDSYSEWASQSDYTTASATQRTECAVGGDCRGESVAFLRRLRRFRPASTPA